ncbi:YciI family protein [Falsibacillus pallidus]|uniref:YciI family protein n=1 Tax=Falsibacillus pallidus TaxID=493781 RepID=UPI003D991E40
MRFLIYLTRGPKWKEEVSLHNQPFMPEHAVYVQKKFDEGKILLAGPFGDQTGGAIIIDAESEKEALKFALSDPAVINGSFTYQLKPWEGLMSKLENRNPQFGQEYIDFKHGVQKELGIIY